MIKVRDERWFIMFFVAGELTCKDIVDYKGFVLSLFAKQEQEQEQVFGNVVVAQAVTLHRALTV